jgi:hypothetical protein
VNTKVVRRRRLWVVEPTYLKEKDSIFSAVYSVTQESDTGAFDEKERISNATKGL